MTKEQRDRILKALAEDRNDYARDCDRRIAEEQGKIIGADYMLQRFLDVLNAESEDKNGNTTDDLTEKNCKTCGQKCAIKCYGCSNWIPKSR